MSVDDDVEVLFPRHVGQDLLVAPRNELVSMDESDVEVAHFDGLRVGQVGDLE